MPALLQKMDNDISQRINDYVTNCRTTNNYHNTDCQTEYWVIRSKINLFIGTDQLRYATTNAWISHQNVKLYVIVVIRIHL